MKTMNDAGLDPIGGRRRNAELVFALGGGRSTLVRQITPYPFHITRPFALDRARPELATLYLQSASGGIYRADRLGLTLMVRAGAAAHVTSQAATIVHDTGTQPASQTTVIGVAEGAFAAFTLDPLVLFPGAALSVSTRIHLAAGAACIIADGIAWHDFTGENRPFGSITTTTIVTNADGQILVRDHSTVYGTELVGERSLLGLNGGAYGSAMLLGAKPRLPSGAALETALDAVACRAGVSALPNESGLGVRMIAANGGCITQGTELLFALGVEAMLGFRPAPRRK